SLNEIDCVPKQPIITDDTGYFDDLKLTVQEIYGCRKRDEYELPSIEGGVGAMVKKDDFRFANEEDLRFLIKEFKAKYGRSVYLCLNHQNYHDDLYQVGNRFSTLYPCHSTDLCSITPALSPEYIDIDSEAFRSLPLETQYEIIGEMRMKSRQASKLTFLEMPSIRMISKILMDNANNFSHFQIQNLLHRNNLTQKLLDVTSEEGNMTAPTPVRIASERNREYILIKNDKNMTGWTIGSVSQKQAEPPPKKLKLSLETLIADSSSYSDKASDSSYEVEPSVQHDESEFNFHPEIVKPLSSGQKIIKYPEENEESDWEEIQILPPSPKLISNVEGKKELSPQILPFTEAVDLAPVTFLGSEECDLTPE
ncbi:hypothetical protein G9A89_000499, partial [Geosiphon pyriformis]